MEKSYFCLSNLLNLSEFEKHGCTATLVRDNTKNYNEKVDSRARQVFFGRVQKIAGRKEEDSARRMIF